MIAPRSRTTTAGLLLAALGLTLALLAATAHRRVGPTSAQGPTPTVAPAPTQAPARILALLPVALRRTWSDPPRPTPLPTLPPVTPTAPPTAPGPTTVPSTPAPALQAPAVPVWLPVIDSSDDLSEVVVQNVGGEPSGVALVVWGEPSDCPPDDAGPRRVTCSGVVAPGCSWTFADPVLANARGGALFSFSTRTLGELVDPDHPFASHAAAQLVCERTLADALGHPDRYTAFLAAYTAGTDYDGIPMGRVRGAPLAAVVNRQRSRGGSPDVTNRGSYAGLAGPDLGQAEALSGQYAYYAPLVPAGLLGFEALVFVQNAGTQCAEVTPVFRLADDCQQPEHACPGLSVAPGETVNLWPSNCLPAPGGLGSLLIRSTGPLAVAVDILDSGGRRSTYTAVAGRTSPPDRPSIAPGRVLHGPLVPYAGGEQTVLVVGNLDEARSTRLRVTWFDRSGDVLGTDEATACAGHARAFGPPPAGRSPAPRPGNVLVEALPGTAGHQPPSAPAGPIAAVLYSSAHEPHQAGFADTTAYTLLAEAERPGNVALAVPVLAHAAGHPDGDGSPVTSDLALANLVTQPGFTDLVAYVYDQNALVDYVCLKLTERETEYIALDRWGYLNPGFRGSALLSATFWEHDLFDESGRFVFNKVGLGGVALGRRGGLPDGAILEPLAALEMTGLDPAAIAAIGPPPPLCSGGPVRMPRSPTATTAP